VDVGAFEYVVDCNNNGVPDDQETGLEPVIIEQPSDARVCEGGSARFEVTVERDGEVWYQWRKEGADIAGATERVLLIEDVDAESAGSYDVVVANSCGIATSEAAELTLREPPTITTEPADRTAFEGEAVTLEAAAAGDEPLSWSWYHEGEAVDGDGARYTIRSAGPGDAGEYRVVVANDCGDAGSRSARVVVFARGDLDCSGALDFADIDPFVIAITSRSEYEELHPDCSAALADINLDGRVDFDDIDPFVVCIVEGRCE
jgi:hypothetical protein